MNSLLLVIIYFLKDLILSYFNLKILASSIYLIPLGLFLLNTIEILNYWNNRKHFFKNIAFGNIEKSVVINSLQVYTGLSSFKSIGLIPGYLLGLGAQFLTLLLLSSKSVLKYLHDAVKERNYSSVGYYVGGMKEKDLKISEGKKVIIATYAMAEEGLDIKTLTTLLMATPRVDVTQAVGRILRMKHDNTEVYDILDQHALFQRHWKKRRAFYKKQKFKILTTTSNEYLNDKWDCIFDAEKKISKNEKKRVKKSKSKTIYVQTDDLIQGKCLIDF